ncbi:MAG: lipocalin-like domain-containing protein [Alloprevotella sp.]|nr:lipocalin-like domain-containing protein [Alloprevotella sp.]
MKRLPTLLPALFLSLALLPAACDKTPENGLLDGMWQLTEQTPAATGQAVDKKPAGCYWSFQLNMMQIHTIHDPHNGVTFNTTGLFTRRADSLHFERLAVHRYNSDSIITDPASTTLDTVGIHGNRGDFFIEALTHSKLVLRSDFNRLVFRKIG